MRTFCVSVGLVLLAITTAWANPPAGKPAEEELVPLMDGLSDLSHPVTTTNPLAQKYFDQGLRLMFAFNHDEAIRAFRGAAKLDPKCAMAHWGIALALGPNYNLEAEKERSAAAYAELLKAQELVAGASPAERDYIAALRKRYSDDPQADRKPLDRAYADAMLALAAKYPDDQDAAVLAAESLMDLRPWDLWSTTGVPLSGTEQIVGLLEGVLEKNPHHIGAIHFYIHAVEASNDPGRALVPARRLGALAPASGHLVHMPAHIYIRMGLYQDSAEANQRAIEADQAYIAKYKPEGIYPAMYYPHNIHFLWHTLAIQGRSAEAIAAGSQVVEKLPLEMVREMPMIEYFLPTRLYALVRFARWDEILREPAPPGEFNFTTGMWHYARGKALAALGRVSEAQAEYEALSKNLSAAPQDALVMRHSVARLLGIAAHDLGAAIALASGKSDDAIGQLRTSILLQDGLLYDEPPAWFQSQREILGRTLLAANRATEAEALFREDLKQWPENGWSLDGLARSLSAQKRAADAEEAQARFAKAWATADFKLP